MSDPRTTAAAVLAELTDAFVATAMARLERLDAAARALQAGSLDDARRQAAEQAAHQLAGAAGTFGFASASRLAHQIERQLGRTTPATPAQAHRLRTRLAVLRAALERPCRDVTGCRP